MRVLLVEDEPIARVRARRALDGIADLEIVGEADNALEALRQIAELKPDFLLLDIDIPGLSGLDLASLPNMPAIIFVTASAEHSLPAFAVGAHDYLLKPLQPERLAAAIERVRERVSLRRDQSIQTQPSAETWRLVVTEGSRKHFVDARKVDLFEAADKYVRFFFDGQELLTRESLDALEEKLQPHGFLRLHRGALARRDAIVAFETSGGGTCVLRDRQRIPVSRRWLAAVRDALGLG